VVGQGGCGGGSRGLRAEADRPQGQERLILRWIGEEWLSNDGALVRLTKHRHSEG
jgi:hypothetical protein